MYYSGGHHPRGGTQIWKWCTSAYRRTKIGGIRCKISSKKGGHSVWAPKKWGLFWCGLSKMGLIQCAKMQFQGKICKFSVKIATKIIKFLKMRAKRAKICNFYVKLDTKVEKRGSLGVDWIKKGVIGCRIGVKKGGLLTGTWYPTTYGSAPPRAITMYRCHILVMVVLRSPIHAN